MDAVRSDIRKFVIENFLFGQETDLRTDDQSFLDSGIIDSTGVLELVGFLESRYRISVADEDLIPDNLDSVARVVGYVQRKVGVGAERRG